jgi:hypothetical protein
MFGNEATKKRCSLPVFFYKWENVRKPGEVGNQQNDEYQQKRARNDSDDAAVGFKFFQFPGDDAS